MTTLGTFVDRLFDSLTGSVVPVIGTLASPLDDSQTTLAFDRFPSAAAANMRLSVGDEDLRVVLVESSTKTMVVQRGAFGSTAAAHTITELVFVNPRFSANHLMLTARDEVASWGPDLVYRPLTATVALPAGTRSVELPAALAGHTGIASVRRAGTDPQSRPKVPSRLETFDSVDWLTLTDYGWACDFTLSITARMPITTSPWVRDTDLAGAGCQDWMLDLLSFGTRARLYEEIEQTRIDRLAQNESRVAEESPPSHALSMSRHLWERRAGALADVTTRLRALEGMGVAP